MEDSDTYGYKWIPASSVVLLALLTSAFAHPLHHGPPSTEPASSATKLLTASTTGVTGQGDLRFRVLYTSSHLPDEAVAVVEAAHGGFAVDRRPGQGQTYFALPGAGIIEISGDLRSTRMVDTDERMKDENMHNATIWFNPDGTPFLTFPANNAGLIFTTTLEGELVHTLGIPSGHGTFDEPTVDDYFLVKGKFAPTDVEQLDNLFYVTTGYSSLDYVLTAKIESTNPFRVDWYELVFGGKGDGAGEFGTGHGITVSPDRKRIDVADRPNSEIDRFTRHGHYRSTWHLPIGSFPCDIDYTGDLAIVGCLHGPNRGIGAPIYILDDGRVVSTILIKEELGLENFQHIHNAVLRKIGQRYYVIAQAWNPGDFAILEQVN